MFRFPFKKCPNCQDITHVATPSDHQGRPSKRACVCGDGSELVGVLSLFCSAGKSWLSGEQEHNRPEPFHCFTGDSPSQADDGALEADAIVHRDRIAP
ncbi:hypothetical protein MATL_G00124750 [Megalops atlanticus]|uniref:Uncharacterized protein n=1 Tax=Megalops atlanticus TaxID=7932 RepID=A0A9D3PUF5_MEGAT|nr:hypothetical protein MATL_G00124750 [Megalops atlanticus]